ncbi:uncharacterized protein SPSK_05866 [Sporothrix schenckii 1099-18]|uniref:Uncharacterized protein n=1 Tax=Sporothrix schenckii 1099-18 TaxID=1397361 RepID=A0A0F2MK31_SPOSC|nr:uncharacterized protein SPSK_05866 [Sporothrix schenckii 1099-18]KJR89962.1 hypothetical protein SPSK_05866 [Sporothrix schenckii 1099-18]
MEPSSRPQSTLSTDPESLILKKKDVKKTKTTKQTKKTKKSKKDTKETKETTSKQNNPNRTSQNHPQQHTQQTQQTQPPKHSRQHVSRQTRRPHTTLALLATILLALASVAGIVLGVLATAVLHLQVPADVPSRIAVFGASIGGVGLAVVQAIDLCSRSRRLIFACQLTTRLVLLAWVASVVLTSLEVARTVRDATVSSTLAAQAVYLNLMLSNVGFLSTAVLSFCLERATRKGQQNAHDRDVEDDDVDDLLDKSVSQRGSLSAETHSDKNVDPADEEPRPKKLLFSYKATTQLMNDTPASRRASMVSAAVVPPAAQPVVQPTVRPSTSIKRKPVHPVAQPAASAHSAVDRRKSVMPPAIFSDPFADPVEENPFLDSNRVDAGLPEATTVTTATTATTAATAPAPTRPRRLSRMSTHDLPRLITSVEPIPTDSTFYLSSSGSSNYDNDEDKEQTAEPLETPQASILPYSPAVKRPRSIVPPVPQVPVPKVTAALMPQTLPQTLRRKPVGSAGPAAATAQAGPIKRKPVPSMPAARATAPKMETPEPLSPLSQPASAEPPILALPVALPATTTQIPMHFASAVSSRKSSNASDMSESDASVASSYTSPSLADMVASSLRRGSVSVAVPTAVSEVFAGASTTTSLPTRSVAYAQPRVFDQPIVRKSFIATTNTTMTSTTNASTTTNGSGSEAHARRPSQVSIMETIYSPADEPGSDEDSENSEKTKGGMADEGYDADLAAMVRQEAEAAAAAADAGRRWLEPSRDSMRDSMRMERTTSMSKHLSRKPSLSPVEEQEQEGEENGVKVDEDKADEVIEVAEVDKGDENSEDEETVDDEDGEANPSVHTIVVHEPAGFTATGLSRTASRMRKAALRAAGQTAQTANTVQTTPSAANHTASTYVPAYTRRRLSTANYNFSRPMRATGDKRVSLVSTMSSTTTKRASLAVVPSVPQTSLLASPRSRVRRQLLQMLPVQHRPITLVKPISFAKPVKAVKVTTPRKGRQSLSGRRHRRSLSLNLASLNTSDDALSSSSALPSAASSSSTSTLSSTSASTSPRHKSYRSTSLAKTAQRARRRNRVHGRHLAGLRSSTLRPSASMSAAQRQSSGSDRLSPHTPYTPYTPRNRPISPMTLLMGRR